VTLLQPSFLDEPPRRRLIRKPKRRRQTIAERFQAWLAKCPEVYAKFKSMAFRIRATGKTRYSAKTIVEVIRWDHDVATVGDDGFKINNIYTSRMVRKLIGEHPEFSGFFETRKIKTP
jgi:hypothetical protein